MRASIRPAGASDAPRIAELWTEAYFTEGGGGRPKPYSPSDFHEIAGQGRVLVAEQSGTVVGAVALFAPGTPSRPTMRNDEAELSRLVVAAPARGNGIGRALTERCTALARAEAWPAIALWSRPYQTAAHHLYESLGYERAPERDTTDETGHGRLVFLLDLSDA